MQRFVYFFKLITDALFPQQCIRCKKDAAVLCKNCLDVLPRAKEHEYPFIMSIFDYHNTFTKEAIRQFKYKNVRGVAQCFGEILYEEIIGELGDDIYISKNEPVLLVPIPLHKKRLRERGYNQSELLAKEITQHDTEKAFALAPRALTRTRTTNTQAKNERRSVRFENLKGAFTANPEIVYRKNIILIDDVTTTGATLVEARKALLKAGARNVKAWTVAH